MLLLEDFERVISFEGIYQLILLKVQFIRSTYFSHWYLRMVVSLKASGLNVSSCKAEQEVMSFYSLFVEL